MSEVHHTAPTKQRALRAAPDTDGCGIEPLTIIEEDSSCPLYVTDSKP